MLRAALGRRFNAPTIDGTATAIMAMAAGGEDDPEFLAPGGALRGPLLDGLLARLGALRELGAGERVGPYRVLREIGRGGMAIVYLAERADGEFEQAVALKWLRPDGDAAAAQTLFRRERQILAALEHPYVARLLDGGHSDDGMLWFALEYVPGERIDEFCVTHALAQKQRLALFIQVCEAVQFAHSRALIHRDIKPANVLVTADRRAKLLDFGIAQLSAGEQAPLAAHAHTPGYASPEQQRGELVTTASDIYQLGRLLREMLGGPARPPDLTAIIDRAMASAPESRYATVAELIEDLGRFLEHRPVRAAIGGIPYRMARFIQRNRFQVSAGVAVTLLVVGLSIWFLLRLATERDIARHEATRANATTAFLIGLFKVSDPTINRGDTLTANQVLENGTLRLQSELKEQPSVRAALLEAIGRVHMNLGQLQRAEPLLREAVGLSREHADTPAEDVAARWRGLAQVQWRLGRYDDALTSARAGYALIADRDDLPEVAARLLNTQAAIEFLLGHFEQTVALEQQSIALIESKLGAEHELAGYAYHNLARALSELDRETEALDALHKAVENVTARLGADDPDVQSIAASYGRQLARVGRYAQAWPVLLAAQDGLKHKLGAEDSRYAYALLVEAEARTWSRDYADSLKLADTALAIYRVSPGTDPVDIAEAEETRGRALAGLDRHVEALASQRAALAIREQQLHAAHVDIAASRHFVGVELCKLGQREPGREQLQQALSARIAALPVEHAAIRATRAAIAECETSGR